MTMELFFALLFAGVIAYGLWDGRMPARWVDLDRTRNPLGFWLGAAVYAVIALAFLLAHFDLRPL
jgi:hypothetical protein